MSERDGFGGATRIKVDVRVIAATSRDLRAMVREGRFREDLYYRLDVLPIRIPPLRERLEDLEALVESLLESIAERTGMPQRELAPGALGVLAAHSWPGNVRELRNVMERASLLSRSGMVLPDHLPARIHGAIERPTVNVEPAEARRLEEIEHEAMVAALKAHSFNRTEAAKALGISRRTLVYKLQRLRDLGFEVDAP